MTGSTRSTAMPSIAPLLRVAFIAGVITAVGNIVIYLLAGALASVAFNVPNPEGEMMALPLPIIVVMSIIPAFAAAGLFYALKRYTAQPLRLFQVVAGVVLLLSMIPLFTLGIEADVQFFLGLMHVYSAAAIVVTFTVMSAERR